VRVCSCSDDKWKIRNCIRLLRFVMSGAHLSSSSVGTDGCFPGSKGRRREAAHWPPGISKVMSTWIYTSAPLYAFVALRVINYTKIIHFFHHNDTRHDINPSESTGPMFCELKAVLKLVTHLIPCFVILTSDTASQNKSQSKQQHQWCRCLSGCDRMSDFHRRVCSVSPAVPLQGTSGGLFWLCTTSQGD
jgi:hypothetical protein